MSDWGDAKPRPTGSLWWFSVGGNKFNHLDLTGGEVRAMERKLGCMWGDMHPAGSVEHRLAFLETFLARSDPDGAAKRVADMTMAEIEDAIDFERRPDDLPDTFEDGLPKAEGAT